MDDAWPVALAIGADGSTSLLSWPRQQPRISGEPDQVTVADGVGIVVRDGAQVAWVRRDGTTFAHVEGEWPDARLVVTMRHRSRPGLVLRRTFPLFDETGAPISHESAGWRLLEDLDTGYLAPAEEAVDGVLDT